MILVADSGSTKTDWRLIDDKKNILQFNTQGLNPYFITGQEIENELNKKLLPQLKKTTSNFKGELFFYGSGCGAEKKKKIVSQSLMRLFPDSKIEIQTDMLGAARALCGKNNGIASILGTGSNSCYYDGRSIAEQSASLGFILGDEGSGAHIGKTLITALLDKELTPGIEKQFFDRFKTNRDEIIDAVYKQPFPNRYLSSFSKFVFQNIKDQQLYDLVANCFRTFFDKQILKLDKGTPHTFHCTGSVGFYFSNILRRVAEEKNIIVGQIVESPIAALTLFHLGE